MAFEQALIVTIVVAAFAMVRLIRKFDLAQRFYLLVVGAAVTLGLLALVRDDRFLGVLCMGMTALTVVLPGLLETLARAAFGAGYMRLAVGIAGLRALLMPGAGLERQQEILQGLALLEREGVDAALDHFHELAGGTEDGGELAIIHEQIVAMLFYGLRWSEGIAHYEGQFHPGYAAVRPALALGLLRAYGESGRLDTAAGLMRALEEGPLGSDPRAIAMLSQARVTFLAYAGEKATVVGVLQGEHLGTLGISRANGALLRGIAAARAGDSETAAFEFRKVSGLAAGPSDDRAVEASTALLAGPLEAGEELEPDLRAYAAAVGGRLRRFLVGTPSLQRHGPLLATPALILAQIAGYVAALWAGSSSTLGLLQVGALTPELWAAGSWARVTTAPFVHGDAIGLLLAGYAIWLGGPVIERLRGSAQLAVMALASGMAGCAAAVAYGAPRAAVVAGGNFLGFGVAFGALWLLLPRFSPGLAPRSRRTLAIPVILVLGACVLAAVPTFLSLDVLPVGLATACVVSVATLLGLPRQSPGWRRGIMVGSLGLMALSVAAGIAGVVREDVGRFLAGNRDSEVVMGNVTFKVSPHVSEVEAGTFPPVRVPVYAGLADRLAARTGTLVQLVVVSGAPKEGSALLHLDPDLGREASIVEREDVPETVRAISPDARFWQLRRNGEAVADLFERRVGEDAVLMVVAPPRAGYAEADLMATIWAEAGPHKP